MSRLRRPAIAAILIASLVLGYLLRDVVYELLVVPLAYMLWLLKVYYSFLPQWVVWALVVVVLFLAGLWNLLPSGRPAARGEPLHGPPAGEVEELAVWLHKARHGNYFKWQLANRLGRIARRLDELSGPGGRVRSPDAAVEKYLDAGLNRSFVDFLAPRNRLRAPQRTPLDVEVNRVADYLESQMENRSDRRR